MKHEIEISDDVAPWGDPDAKPLYCVRATFTYDYRNDNNYRCESEDNEELLSAETIDELYEQMGEAAVSVILKNEDPEIQRWADYKDSHKVRFSEIFVQVDAYNEEKMRASKKFQEIGIAREIKKKEDAERQRLERERQAQWKAAEQEKRDAEEYQRLRKKFEKV